MTQEPAPDRIGRFLIWFLVAIAVVVVLGLVVAIVGAALFWQFEKPHPDPAFGFLLIAGAVEF
jgi:hypothetical protein